MIISHMTLLTGVGTLGLFFGKGVPGLKVGFRSDVGPGYVVDLSQY